MLKYGIIFTAALVSSVIFTFSLSKIALKSKLLKINNIPLVGGLGIGLAFVFSVSLGFFMFDLSFVKISVIAGTCWLILFLGVLDDLKELSVMQKFLAQSFCAIALITFGIRTNIVYIGFWPNAIISFFWIVGITNAFNLLDIMDGLAVGTSLIISSAFLFIGLVSGDLNVVVLSLILTSVSLGFLIFNLPPAKVYLGNSGSHFLGLFIACVALIAHYASMNNAFALLSPLMILGLPIIDTLILIIFRVIKKKQPFKKSKDHIALKIGALGFSPFKTILIMYFLCLIFVGCGLVLTRLSNFSAAIITICIFLLSLGLFLKLAKIEANA